MDKPVPKKYEVRIIWSSEQIRRIAVASSRDMLEDFKEFCVNATLPSLGYYELSISPYYDFDEVLQYIRSKENG